MHEFTPNDLVASESWYRLYRSHGVVAMEVRGVVDDERARAFRAAVAREFGRGGAPRFFAMDVSAVDPQTSLGERMRTAAFIREALGQVRAAVCLTRDAPGPTVIVRTVLRVVGRPNVALYTDAAAFERALSAMRLGLNPVHAAAPSQRPPAT